MNDPELVGQKDNSRSWLSRRVLVKGGIIAALFGGPPFFFLMRHLSREQLEVVVEGPFTNDQFIEIRSTKTHVIQPVRLNVMRRGARSILIEVQFEFQGPEIPSRKMEVNLTARDRWGEIVASKRSICGDQRIFARETTGKRMGSNIVWVDSKNSESITLPISELSRVDRVELFFREV